MLGWMSNPFGLGGRLGESLLHKEPQEALELN